MTEKKYNDIKLIDHLKYLFPIFRSITRDGTRKNLKNFEKFNKD